MVKIGTEVMFLPASKEEMGYGIAPSFGEGCTLSETAGGSDARGVVFWFGCHSEAGFVLREYEGDVGTGNLIDVVEDLFGVVDPSGGLFVDDGDVSTGDYVVVFTVQIFYY